MLIPLAGQADIPTPQEYLDSRKGNPHLQTTTGEQLAWHFNSGASRFVDAFLALDEDTAWLEAAEEYFDYGIELAISNDPDGYPGTIGAQIGDDLSDPDVEHVYDTVIGDALFGEHITRWAEVVINRPHLHDQFLDKAEEYLDLATEMVWEKWNVRDTYYQDSRGYGSYHTHPYAIDRYDRDTWIPRPNRKISDNLNKHYRAGLVFLRLYRITGNTEYRDRVIEIFGRAKAMFRLYPEEDRVVWNFWMPHGPHDMTGSTPASWVGVHPNRPGYQSTEASEFLEVYNTGLVFSEKDMERIVNTNVWMMENDFVSADGSSDAGTLWGSLAQLDERIRDRRAETASGISLAYLNNVIDENFGYDRWYVDDPDDIIIDDVEVQPGTQLSMALPIPDTVETINDDEIQLVAATREAGPITIDLLTADGAFIGNLHSGNATGNYYTILWDGTNPETGERDWDEYLIRWTLNDESRTWPVVVEEGEEREEEYSALTIRPGQTLAYDFASELDERWVLSGAEPSDENPHTGSHSLRIERGQRAELVFGDASNLPVRIEFWRYDTGVQWSQAEQGNASGTTIGVETALGDVFAFYNVWRHYMDGNAVLGWVNTADNQWFSIWNSGFERNHGWNHWVFDFTDPEEEPVISRNGVAFDNTVATDRNPMFLPDGAVKLVFIGTRGGLDSEEANPDSVFYIDDVVVSDPRDPISIFEDSPGTENVGGGWKWNMLGLLYDAEFPFVYSVGIGGWLYVHGFSELGYYFWSYPDARWAYTASEFYPYYIVLTGDEAGTWVKVEN